MTSKSPFVIALLLAVFAGLGVAAQAPATGDAVAFPADYATGVLYWTQDRPQNNQVREYYATRGAVEAARTGAPLPSGTVITVVQYAARLGPDDQPMTDAGGRFIKGDIVGYTAMEKRTGWGAEYPEDVRNGDWKYQVFTPDRTPNTNVDLARCFSCHKSEEANDYVFSDENLRAPE